MHKIFLLLQKIFWFFPKRNQAEQANLGQVKSGAEIICCSDKVHIAYRGLSDNRLYLSYNRDWQELKFYRANGLRVFCANCRLRVELES